MRTGALIVTTFTLVGCVSEKEVYQRNLHPDYLSPLARRLPKSELDQVARLMAQTTRQSIIGISGPKNEKYRGELMVYTAYPGATERGRFGLVILEKKDKAWHVVTGGEDLDPTLSGMVRMGL